MKTSCLAEPASVVITVAGRNGEDTLVYELGDADLSVVANQTHEDPWFDTLGSFSQPPREVFEIRPHGSYRIRVEPGAITKGARALYEDKYPDLDPPQLNSFSLDVLAQRLRRKAKAVLVAADKLN